MKIQINRLHYPVTVLGPGRRVGIWLQGCGIECPGCMASDTWPSDSGKSMDVVDVVAWCRDVAGSGPDGVTISGGEPFEQPEALSQLLDELRRWRDERADPFDILCYSGMPLARLFAMHADILSRLDALIPEPFIASRPRGAAWRGSDNQPLLALSPLGRHRYADYIAARVDRCIQVNVTGNRVWFIGIPDRGDLAALQGALRGAGIELEDVSWRP